MRTPRRLAAITATPAAAAVALLLMGAAMPSPAATQAAGAPPILAPGQATPVQAPYDTTADAHAQVDAAFAAARATNRKVLIDFGGNWCPDCRMLAGVLEEPAVAAWSNAHFVTVMVDIGRRTKNMDIAAKYGIKVEGVPAVLVITPDGKLLNGSNVAALADARSWSQQAVVDQLAKWQ
jgi:thiol-disulfide isomerase/thioredoxin